MDANHIDIDNYHDPDKTPGISATGLIQILRSPAHFKAWTEQPPKETNSMIFGRALHCAVLEPNDFVKRFAAAPKVDKRTNAGKVAYADFVLAHPKSTVLDQDDYDKALAIAEKVRKHRTVASFLLETAEIEGTLCWEDEKTGVLLKARPDIRLLSGRIIDLKTCQDARVEAFSRNIFTYSYHVQLATYMEGVRIVHGQHGKMPVIIAVEKEPPYAVSVFQLDKVSIEIGHMEFRYAVNIYAECNRRDYWPSYPVDLQEISLPAWAGREVG